MLLRSVNQTCDAYNNLCSFYVVVSEPTKEFNKKKFLLHLLLFKNDCGVPRH